MKTSLLLIEAYKRVIMKVRLGTCTNFIRIILNPPLTANFTAVMGKLFINSDVPKILASQLLKHPTPLMETAIPSPVTSQLLQLPSPTVTLSLCNDCTQEQSAADALVTSLSVTLAISAALVIVLSIALISLIIVKQ